MLPLVPLPVVLEPDEPAAPDAPVSVALLPEVPVLPLAPTLEPDDPLAPVLPLVLPDVCAIDVAESPSSATVTAALSTFIIIDCSFVGLKEDCPR
jgi:hypothetical protein